MDLRQLAALRCLYIFSSAQPAGSGPSASTLGSIHVTHWQVLLVSSIAWAIWIPAAGLQNSAKGNKSGVSILPIFPGCPLVVWGIAFLAGTYGLNSIPLWLVIIHLVLLLALLFSIARSAQVLRQQRRAKDAA